MSIPSKFETTDVLAPGTYEATFPELHNSLLVRGDGTSATWDTKWRGYLVSNLEVLAMQLRSVGLTELFIDGSFVENKDHPSDIDGYFDTGIELVTPTAMAEISQKISDLNSLDPYKIWNWDPQCRVQDVGSGKRQIPMWVRYRVELYPHIEGLFSGIKDQFGNNLQFPSAFRQSRRGFIQKGIVKIKH